MVANCFAMVVSLAISHINEYHRLRWGGLGKRGRKARRHKPQMVSRRAELKPVRAGVAIGCGGAVGGWRVWASSCVASSGCPELNRWHATGGAHHIRQRADPGIDVNSASSGVLPPSTRGAPPADDDFARSWAIRGSLQRQRHIVKLV